MKSLDALFKADATALSLRQKRMEILGSNIANAATPHFKARDIDFESDNKEQNKNMGNKIKKIKKKIKKNSDVHPNTTTEIEIEPIILEDTNSEILYVVHLSDIHIKKCDKSEEYKGVFNNLFENLKSKNLNQIDWCIV